MAVVALLNCESIGPFNVLVSYPDVSCSNSQYKALRSFAIFLLASDVVAVPIAILLALIWSRRKRLLSEEAFRQRWGVLFEGPTIWLSARVLLF